MQRHQLVGDDVRKHRAARQYSQEKLVERANLSATFIGRVERGCESPSLDSLVKIAKGLGVKVRDLVADL